MFPPIRKARPPNIRFSVTSGSPATSSRMRFARASSYAMAGNMVAQPQEWCNSDAFWTDDRRRWRPIHVQRSAGANRLLGRTLPQELRQRSCGDERGSAHHAAGVLVNSHQPDRSWRPANLLEALGMLHRVFEPGELRDDHAFVVDD